MGKVISFANQKGGSGKTTLSANLSVLWSNSGYKVAIVDADNQRSISNWYNSRKKYYGEDDTGISHYTFDSVDISQSVKDIKNKYDFIIIDSPPSITITSLAIIRVSNHIFVPVQPSPIDLLATIPFLDLINKEKRKSTIILNRVLPRVRLTEAMILRLRYSGASIARSKISSRVIFAETFTVGRGVADISVTTQPSKEILKLGSEIIRKLR
tara:strand:- start:44 stop:679 length:636 start_codon:yes stop_codon:yes gene_type:complete